MNSGPRVSIIILSYNRREEIIKCLESVSKQSYENIETLVLDNCSSDGSVEAIQNNFPEVNILRMPKNYGDWEGRDIAFSNCHGKYTAIVDNDAILTNDVITNLVERVEKESKVAIAEPRVEDPHTGEPFSCSPSVADITHYRANFIGCTALFRTEVLRRVGGFPHYLLGGAELHLAFRVIDLGYRICHIGDTVVYHERSDKERLPHRRLFLQTKQKTRAAASHYPDAYRAYIDILWKAASYSYKAFASGYSLSVPKNALSIIKAGLVSRAHSEWKVKQDTVNTMDYLETNIVKSKRDYEMLPSDIDHFSERIKSRFPIGVF